MIYLIADTHFNHENIIKYCNRPFKNAKEMNEYIIEKWNLVVKNDDIVYHLGDVGFGSDEEIKEILSRLNGNKILIKGNHDLRRGSNGWLRVGFKEIHNKAVEINRLILTHYPIDVKYEYVNVFGHIHDKPLDEKYDKINHICVSCDVIDYTPVNAENLKLSYEDAKAPDSVTIKSKKNLKEKLQEGLDDIEVNRVYSLTEAFEKIDNL